MSLVVFVTIPKSKAKFFAKILLKEKACACVNILKDVESLFLWQGKIDRENESLLIIKTKDRVFPKLEKIILKNHPYKVPEIIALKIDKIGKSYEKWLNKEVCD